MTISQPFRGPSGHFLQPQPPSNSVRCRQDYALQVALTCAARRGAFRRWPQRIVIWFFPAPPLCGAGSGPGAASSRDWPPLDHSRRNSLPLAGRNAAVHRAGSRVSALKFADCQMPWRALSVQRPRVEVNVAIGASTGCHVREHVVTARHGARAGLQHLPEVYSNLAGRSRWFSRPRLRRALLDLAVGAVISQWRERARRHPATVCWMVYAKNERPPRVRMVFEERVATSISMRSRQAIRSNAKPPPGFDLWAAGRLAIRRNRRLPPCSARATAVVPRFDLVVSADTRERFAGFATLAKARAHFP